jgi:hypothetical protein
MKDLENALNNDLIVSDLRPYAGLSLSGSPCRRFLQYVHYWAFQDIYSTRIQRLFDVGNAAETVMIADLEKHGYTVHSEQAEIIGFAGHWKGHIDGEIDDDWLWEAKTHNEKSFKDLKNKGVQLSKPMHHVQINTYMGYRDKTDALYMALNKNTSEYHIELIPFDPDLFTETKIKCADVITTDVLFKRIGNNSAAWFECKLCNARNICFDKKPINKTCRSCQHVEVRDNGQWWCNNYSYYLTEDMQKAACDQYKLWDMFYA